MRPGWVPYATGDDGYPDVLTIYLRCPYCSVLAVPLGVVYTPGPSGGIDPGHLLVATCALCAADYTTTPAAVRPRDGERRCARCDVAVAVPADADEVICPACRLHQPGPAALVDAWRAAAVERVRAGYTGVVRARLRARFGLPAEHRDERPNYLDDPLMESARAAHQLMLHVDPRVRLERGRPGLFGVCSCNEWVTPSWDLPTTVLEAYDEHMREIQESTRTALPR